MSSHFAAKIAESIGEKWGTNPSPDLISKVWNMARAKQLDPETIVSLVSLETKGTWDPNIVADDTHGFGLFQLDDRYHKQFREDLDAHINYGLDFFKNLLSRSKDDYSKALSRYNTGNEQAGLTNGYVKSVEDWKQVVKAGIQAHESEFFYKELKGYER
jgi:hypothetical protein